MAERQGREAHWPAISQLFEVVWASFGLGFRVWGLGFGLRGLGFGVRGLGFGVCSFVDVRAFEFRVVEWLCFCCCFRVQGLVSGLGAQGSGLLIGTLRLSGSGFWVVAYTNSPSQRDYSTPDYNPY